jgi:cytidylate kinase
MNEKVKDIQKYLKKKGIDVAETSIVDMAIDLAERLGPGRFVFVSEAIYRKEKAEREKTGQRDG